MATGAGQVKRAAGARKLAVAAPASDVFNLDAIQDEAEENPFRFQWGGVVLSLAHANAIDYHLILAADTGSISAIVEAFTAGFTPADLTVWESKRAGAGALTTLFHRWLEHSGLRVGE